MAARYFDIANFISKLSFWKIFNSVLLYKSYYLSRIIKHPVHWGMPISASIEATTLCNLHCPECPAGLKRFTRNIGTINIDAFKKYLDALGRQLIYLTFYFQGEPYLNKDFFDIITYAESKKIYTATSTNGHFLDDENAMRTITSGLDSLIISLDGIDQESYSAYRQGGDFEKVIDGIKNIVRWKKKLSSHKPYIILQCLVLKSNEFHLTKVKKLADELGIDKLELKTAQFYHFKNGNALMPENPKYSRYLKLPFDTYKLKKKTRNHCLRMWQSLVITWDGKVVPCCFDKDAAHQLGNMESDTLKRIWHGKNYKTFRKTILLNRKQIDICCNCTE